MLIQQLRLQNFRNLVSLDLKLHGGVTLVQGLNGQGKSNLLEALHLVSQGWTPRTRHLQELIRWSESSFWVAAEGLIQNENRRTGIEYSAKEHRVRIDGRDTTLFSQLLGVYGVAWLAPEDLEIIRGGPALRRKFMDSLFSQHDPAYLAALRRYKRSLAQRNALLKMGLPQGQDQLFESVSWEWAQSAATLMERRQLHLQTLGKAFKEIYREMVQDVEKVHIVYRSEKEEADPVQALLQESQRLRDAELRDGITHCGPHRDDLLLLLAGKPMRQYASQGQCRSAALSLKLGAAQLLEIEMGSAPILLLDDVFAELDGYRQQALGRWVQAYPQVLVAAPERAGLPLEVGHQISVSQGQVHYV
jgi:DNA replication and repair protein RecF